MKHKGEPINAKKCYTTFGISCIIHTFFLLIFKLLNQNLGKKKKLPQRGSPKLKTNSNILFFNKAILNFYVVYGINSNTFSKSKR